MSNEVYVELPARPISIQPGEKPGLTKAILGMLFLIVFAVGTTIWIGPGLVRDATIMANPVSTDEFKIVKGGCTTRRAVITSCDASFRYRAEGVTRTTKVDFIFLGVTAKEIDVHVVYAQSDPGKATLSLAIEQFWSRIWMWAVLSLAPLGVALWGTRRQVRLRNVARALAQPGQLRQVAVKVLKVADHAGGHKIDYIVPGDAAGLKKYSAQLGKGYEPLVWHSPSGDTMSLAVFLEGHSSPVLLDRGLTRLDLTDQERAVALGNA